MFFQPKVILGCALGLGIGVPSYIYSGGGCLSSYIVIPWNSNLGTNNAILECRDDSNSKNYSVYLVFKEDQGENSSKVATLKVVDNNTQKVMWGPDADKSVSWDQWGIISSYEESAYGAGSTKEAKRTTEIRVPTKRSWRQQNVTISCQKSIIQMKKGMELTKAGPDASENKKCTSSLLRSKNMNFEVLKDGNCQQGWFGKKTCDINLSDKFEWYLGSEPKAVVCNS